MTDSYTTTPSSDVDSVNTITVDGKKYPSIKKERQDYTLSLSDIKSRVAGVGYTRCYVELTTGVIEESIVTAVDGSTVENTTVNGNPMMRWWNTDDTVEPDDEVLEINIGGNMPGYLFPESKVFLK